MRFNNPYWTPRERINMLQRWILVHSIIYYEMNQNVVQDHDFDRNSRLLMRYKSKYGSEYEQSDYYQIFKSFDGTTGFDLYHKLNNAEMRYFTQQAYIAIAVAKEYGLLTT